MSTEGKYRIAPPSTTWKRPTIDAQRGSTHIRGWVGMLLSASPACAACEGSGWRRNWSTRTIQRCDCTDKTEVVTGE